MASNFVILSLLGFFGFQAVQCHHHISYSSSSMQSTTLPVSRSIFYNDDGSSILSKVYPYYSFYSFRPSQKLVDDYDQNQQLALYSSMYNVPLSDLYQLENIIDNNLPLLPSDLETSMLQDLCKVIQNEKIRDYTNPFQDKLNPSSNPSTSLTMAQLMGYLPSDFPPAYMYLLNYLDSLVPCLSPDALAEIQNAVYSNTPSSMLSQADDLTFQLEAAIRYMLSNEMYFIPNY